MWRLEYPKNRKKTKDPYNSSERKREKIHTVVACGKKISIHTVAYERAAPQGACIATLQLR